MTTAFDDEFVPLALEMIEEDGKSVIFKTYPAAAYDPASGETVVGSVTSSSEKVIPPFHYEEKYINGDTIQLGDMQTGIAASGLAFVPDPSITKVVIDSAEWTIVNMNSIYSGEEIALYMLQLRK